MFINLPNEKLLELAEKYQGQLRNGEITFPNDKEWNAFIREAAAWHSFYNMPRALNEPIN